MAPCKAGKEKNANGRCVKIKTQAACKGNKVRNEKGRCVTPRRSRCPNGSRRNKSGNCVKHSLRRSRSRSRSVSRRWGDLPVRPARGAKTQFAKDIKIRKHQIEKGHKKPINKLNELKNRPKNTPKHTSENTPKNTPKNTSESDQQGYGILRWIE